MRATTMSAARRMACLCRRSGFMDIPPGVGVRAPRQAVITWWPRFPPRQIGFQKSPALLPLVAGLSLEQGALDELREDRNDHNLHVPLLTVPGMHGHVLQLELELDGQTPQLHDLADAHTDGHRPDVPGR